ncbi:penicillin-binding protein 1C [Duganella sp. LX20W]|uniref:peptidoglycan glycosyltransferase n=1 Tax=Rugamonas brunnea TaxID=2758569 RepID=A0A7W2IE47_9BURK|nr:penicillin-binding protein 1C [Rugamonas brunnea]MBA5640003.1 penicillin-binding protein 1C [Rugamonas brunnea]
MGRGGSAATVLAAALAAELAMGGAPAKAAPAGAAAIPTPEQVRAAYMPSDAQLLDRHGQPVQSLRVNLRVRRLPWTALDDISPSLPGAVLQAEDQRFYQHDGVDLKAIGKAAWDNLWRKRARGASTVTMQLAAQLDPAIRGGAAGRSWGQKWDQMLAARQLEAGWSKPQILEAYLNLVSFRGELQGVGAAARGLFGKAPSGLNQTESVILASLLRAPEAPAPQVASRACALARELRLADSCAAIEQSTVLALSRPLLASPLPPAPQVARQLLKEGAGPVRSTLDGDLQRYAQAALRQQLMALRTRNVNDGAVVVLDNASGDILAYVGNAGGSDVDGVAALRQAGSTLKPFLYELALERRLITAASLLEDSQIDISTPSGLYIPQNYDKEFKGYVSARTSLASSLNVPAVRTLLMTGLDRFYERLHVVGLDSLTEGADYYGYSLALGSAEVSLLELTNAYRTLASGGLQGTVGLLPRPAQARRRVLDAGATFIVGDVLADRAARSVTFGLKNELATTVWSAVKTGTSKDMRDNWCLGYTERYTVGVWVGNFDGQSMWDVSGVSGAAPVWRDVIDYLHQHEPSRAPVAPAGVLRRQVAFEPALEAPRAEWFLAGTETPVVALVDDGRRAPRILYPGQSSIIAIDPDIPDASQRVTFQAQAGQGLQWRLDGAVLGQAGADYAWRPVAGAHQLALVDADARVIAETRFHVR